MCTPRICEETWFRSTSSPRIETLWNDESAVMLFRRKGALTPRRSGSSVADGRAHSR